MKLILFNLFIKDVMKVITGHPLIASEAKFATALKCSITYYNMNLFQSLKDSLGAAYHQNTNKETQSKVEQHHSHWTFIFTSAKLSIFAFHSPSLTQFGASYSQLL